MGYSLSWVAVKGGNSEAIYSILGVRPNGQREEVAESKIVSAELPTGWILVLFNRKELKDETLARLSSLGEVAYCFVEDHVMFSTASAWSGGKRLWCVTRDTEKGSLHLEASGQLPSSFAAIRDRLFAKQNANGGEKSDTDFIYDIPADLAREITGFRHDVDTPGMTGDRFQVLEETKRPGFLRGLFRRNNR